MSVEGKKKSKLGSSKRKKSPEEKAIAKTKKEKTVKKVASKKEAAPKNEVGHRVGSSLDLIYQCFKEKKGMSKVDILEKLQEKFPERDPEKMKRTLSLQISRMPKEKDFKLIKDEQGRYKAA